MNECRLVKQLITTGFVGSACCGCKPPRAAPHSSHPLPLGWAAGGDWKLKCYWKV